MKTIDARGLSCPEPVIRTKNALASGEKAYTVMVDNVTAKENVSPVSYTHLDVYKRQVQRCGRFETVNM